MKSRQLYAAIAGMFSALVSRLKDGRKSRFDLDVQLNDPYNRPRSRAGTTSNRPGRRRLFLPSVRPGTITYRDWLVKELGYDRRLADGYLFAHRNGYNVKMPMPDDLKAAS